MTSVAARKRAKRQSAKLTPRQSRKAPTSGIAHSPPQTQAYREKTGLEWLLHKRRISERQARAGKRYGEDYRIAQTDGVVPLRSCLNDSPGGGDSKACHPYAVVETEAQARLTEAREALHSADLVAVANAICGRELTPWQAVGPEGSARDVAKVEALAPVALDLLAKHYSAR